MNDISGEIRYFPGHSTSENQHGYQYWIFDRCLCFARKNKIGKIPKNNNIHKSILMQLHTIWKGKPSKENQSVRGTGCTELLCHRSLTDIIAYLTQLDRYSRNHLCFELIGWLLHYEYASWCHSKSHSERIEMTKKT